MIDIAWAAVIFTGAIAVVEIRRSMGARLQRQLERVQRSIELVYAIGRWDWPTIEQGGRNTVLEASSEFAELWAIVHLPRDDGFTLDVKNVLNGLTAILRGSHGVDQSKEIDRIKKRIERELMGWVEESVRLRSSWWLD